jgi:hypothetical protein
MEIGRSCPGNRLGRPQQLGQGKSTEQGKGHVPRRRRHAHRRSPRPRRMH